MHYVCVKDSVTGEVEMKLTDHSNLTDKERENVSTENIDVTGKTCNW